MVGTAKEAKAVPRAVEAVDGLQQAETGDLLEVLERLLPALVSAGERADERHEGLDGGAAGRRRALAAGALDVHAVGGVPRRAARRALRRGRQAEPAAEYGRGSWS